MLHHMLRAAAQRAFSVVDPYFKYVTMLLHGDGSALGSDTVTPFNSDASTNNFNITINGDARSNNFNPYQEGYYSNYFDGSGDTLNTASNAAFGFGSGAWTFEAWVYPTVAQTDNWIIATNDSGKLRMRVGASGYLSFYTDTGSIGLNSTTVVTVNAWSHVAICYDGTTLSLFQNGTRTATSTVSISNGSANACYIGSNTVGGGYWNGYISNARVVKGSAVYSGATYTVPTTPLSAISGTSLLTCQSNRFIDNSTNAFTITKNGDTAVSPAQPFTLPSSVATYGSAYLDGTGDYLTTPSSASISNFSGDFTIEGWVYLNATTAYGVLIGGSGSSGWYVEYGSARGFGAYDGSTFLNGSSTAVTNQWVNFAVTRASGTVRFFINGTLTASSSSANFNVTQSLGIGAYSGGSSSLNGYLSNLRINNTSALYTASYTPSTTPLTAITNTSLLTTQYNGAGNNSGFKDSSQNNFPITRNGNTTQGTFTPYGSNWSIYSDGSGDSVTAPSNTAFAFGTGDFTIEFWAFIPSWTNEAQLIGAHTAFVGLDWLFQQWNSGEFRWLDSSLVLQSGYVPPTNQWNHYACTRSGTTLRIFVNGVQRASGTSTANIGSTKNVGMLGDTSGAQSQIGYMSNVRIVKGTALYTSAFTPSTTPLTAISGTSLLTCADNRFIDDSTNNFTITVNGNTSVQRFSPFSPTTAYSTSVIGGSGYFDGSGDYLNLTSNASLGLGTGTYTAECWVYASAAPAYSVFFEVDVSGLQFGVNASANIAIAQQNVAFTVSSSTPVPLNAWSHIAVSRDGSNVTRIYLNGVQIASATDTTNYATGTTAYINNNTGNSNKITGYIADLRVLKGTALYTSTFTPNTAPLTAITNTVLLLNTTNDGIFDNAMMNDLETVGNAQISTSVKKYGTGSMYFDGDTDYVGFPKNENVNFGSGNFTIEFWVNWIAFGSDKKYCISVTNASNYWQFNHDSSTGVGFLYNNGSGPTIVINQGNNSGWSTGTWYHVALVRNGTALTVYRDGTSLASGTLSAALTNHTTFCIGGSAGFPATTMNGYIDDLRITKGVARYTTTFTPPTAAFPNN